MKPSGVETEIHRAVPEDAAEIAALLHEAFVEFKADYTDEGFTATTPGSKQVEVRMSEGPVWVALCNGAIAGTVSAVEKKEGLYIRGMAVLPAARGHALGDLLLAVAETYAAAHGCTRLFLSTTPFLTRAIRLYERWGFVRTEDGPKDLFGTPLFTMVKEMG